MNNNAVKEILNAVGALAEMSLNFYRALLNAGATKEEAFVLLQSFISASTVSYTHLTLPTILRV